MSRRRRRDLSPPSVPSTVRAACSGRLPGCDSRGPAREAHGTRTASRRPASSTGNLLISEQPARGAGDLARSLTALPFASEGSLRSPSRLAGRRPARGARPPQKILGVSLPVYKRLIPPFARVYKRSVGRRLGDSLPRSVTERGRSEPVHVVVDRDASAYPRLPVSDECSDASRNRGANRRGSSGHSCRETGRTVAGLDDQPNVLLCPELQKSATESVRCRPPTDKGR